MLDEKRVLEFYIDFVNKSLNELIQLSAWESELFKKTNFLNRKKNLQSVQQKYQQYSCSVRSKWEQIYNSPIHFTETLNNTGLLYRNKTLYAIKLNQRHVEQFFFRLFEAVNAYISYLNYRNLNKATHSEMFSGASFSFVKLTMGYAFSAVLKAIKNHDIIIDDTKKKAFVEINQKLLIDITIKYRIGEDLSDARINQLLMDIEEGEKRKKEAFYRDVENGNIKIQLTSYETKEELINGLERESCDILARLVCGSSLYYNSLPELPFINPQNLLDIVANIDMHTQKSSQNSNMNLEFEETNAMYLGIVTGYVFLKSLSMTPSLICKKFLQLSILPEDVPSHVLSFMGIERSSIEAKKIDQINNELLYHFTSMVKDTSQYSKDSLSRTIIAIEAAYKFGYHLYLRMNNVLPGNTLEEDQIIIKQL